MQYLITERKTLLNCYYITARSFDDAEMVYLEGSRTPDEVIEAEEDPSDYDIELIDDDREREDDE